MLQLVTEHGCNNILKEQIGNEQNTDIKKIKLGLICKNPYTRTTIFWCQAGEGS